MTERILRIGCVADDFTGGSDAASFLALGGMKTILISGIPDQDLKLPEDCEAAVIALKSRTQETSRAVDDTLAAARWLKDMGTQKYYFKYCSTFDSTPEGNIGPVTDALMEELGVKATILCPALPANGRTVQDGILYVNGVKLEESSMKDHPLTPMRKSRIKDLMEEQGKYRALEIRSDMLHSEEKAEEAVREFEKDNPRFYLVPDYQDEEDAEAIVRLFGNMKLLTGGSGILRALAASMNEGREVFRGFPRGNGKALIVAGSCSSATRAQELFYEKSGAKMVRLSDAGILSGEENPESLWEMIRDEETPLVYSYDTPEGLALKRNEEGKALAAKVEKTLAGLAKLACEKGVRRIIAAGGETSGAVTESLGYHSFWIGESIAPGVPVLIPVEAPQIRLVLKSGNFGQEDFFSRALEMTGEENG